MRSKDEGSRKSRHFSDTLAEKSGDWARQASLGYSYDTLSLRAAGSWCSAMFILLIPVRRKDSKSAIQAGKEELSREASPR